METSAVIGNCPLSSSAACQTLALICSWNFSGWFSGFPAQAGPQGQFFLQCSASSFRILWLFDLPPHSCRSWVTPTRHSESLCCWALLKTKVLSWSFYLIKNLAPSSTTPLHIVYLSPSPSLNSVSPKYASLILTFNKRFFNLALLMLTFLKDLPRLSFKS